MRQRSHPRRPPGLLAAPALLLAACSSPSGGPGVASLGDAPPSGDVDHEVHVPEDPDEANAAFEACMAEYGIEISLELDGHGGPQTLDVPLGEGAANGDPLELDIVEGDEGDIDIETFEEANRACGQLLAAVPSTLELNPEEDARMREAFLAFEECMAAHGIELFADAAPVEQPGADSTPTPAPAEDLDLQAWEAAEKQCERVWDDLSDLVDRGAEVGD